MDGKYENSVFCTFNMDDTDSVMFLRYYDSDYDTNIYDYFYHYIPDNLKCLYADLLKVLLPLIMIVINFVKLYSILIYFNL